MKRRFPLDGLLRLRRLNEDRAAVDLAAARGRSDDAEARTRLTRAVLGDMTTDAEVSTAALHALAASRASSSAMLSELTAVAHSLHEAREQAEVALIEARSQASAVEKLAEKHADAVIEGDLRADQSAIDEIATSAVLRRVHS